MAYSPRLLGQPSPPSQIGEKLAKTWDILKPYVTGPADAWVGLMNADPYTLLSDTGPAAQRAVENSFNVAGTMAGGSSVVPKPANALMMGADISGGGKKYIYSMQYRPPTNATVPPGFSAFGPQTGEYKFGTVEYTRPLSSKEVTDYELVPLDPKHPINLKKSFDEFHGKFMDEFSNAGETYQSPSGDFIVTPSITGDGWQITNFTPEGEASGHDVVSDFDELARRVWASQHHMGRK